MNRISRGGARIDFITDGVRPLPGGKAVLGRSLMAGEGEPLRTAACGVVEP